MLVTSGVTSGTSGTSGVLRWIHMNKPLNIEQNLDIRWVGNWVSVKHFRQSHGNLFFFYTINDYLHMLPCHEKLSVFNLCIQEDDKGVDFKSCPIPIMGQSKIKKQLNPPTPIPLLFVFFLVFWKLLFRQCNEFDLLSPFFLDYSVMLL